MPVHGSAPTEHGSCHGAQIFLGHYVDVLGNHIAITRLDARSLSVSIVSSGNEKKEVVDRASVHDCTLSLWNLTGTPTPEGEIRWSNAAVWSRNGQSPSYVHRTSTEPEIAASSPARVILAWACTTSPASKYSRECAFPVVCATAVHPILR